MIGEAQILVSGVRDRRMMLELWKRKLEELPFDIAVAKYIAMEQSDKDVEAIQGVKESIPVDYPSQGHVTSLNLRKKLSLQRKRVSHPLKIRVLKVATALLEIMVINVVLSKTIKCHVL